MSDGLGSRNSIEWKDPEPRTSLSSVSVLMTNGPAVAGKKTLPVHECGSSCRSVFANWLRLKDGKCIYIWQSWCHLAADTTDTNKGGNSSEWDFSLWWLRTVWIISTRGVALEFLHLSVASNLEQSLLNVESWVVDCLQSRCNFFISVLRAGKSESLFIRFPLTQFNSYSHPLREGRCQVVWLSACPLASEFSPMFFTARQETF